MSEIIEVAAEAVEEPQQNPIIQWAESRPYWEKYIWKKCLENGDLTDTELGEAFKYFKMEYDLAEQEDLPELSLNGLVPPEDAEMDVIHLKEVKNCENVNAIPNDQCLQFGKQLTLVWGGNGSGKSGYGRLMANACFSRGKRIIHPNLKEENVSTEPATADIVIDDGTEDGNTVQYVDNGASAGDLKRFAVFDKESVPIRLDRSNSVHFTPGQLVVFDHVNSYIYAIEEKLKTERDALKKENPVENSFADTTSIVSKLLLDLTAEVTVEQIKELTAFPEDGDEQIAKLKEEREALRKLDVPAKKKTFAEEQQTLTRYKQALETVWKHLTDENVAVVNGLVKEVIDKNTLVEKLGVDKFDDGIFETTGSENWKGLLVAAKKLYEAEQVKADDNELEHCLLCHQELTDKEKQLFKDYWAFLGSTAEAELRNALGKLTELQQVLQTLRLKLPETNDEQPAIKILLETEDAFVSEVRTGIEKLGEIFKSWDDEIGKLEPISNEHGPELNLETIDNLVAAKKDEEGKLKDPTDDIEKLKGKIVELQHKKITLKIQEQILQYAAWLSWNDKASATKIPKAMYTGTRTEFFNQIVTEEFTRIFNKECKNLDSEVGLEIESHGEHGDTVIGLQLGFAKNVKPTEVLSEGEQKVCALADFLSEVQLDKNNCGIIFDDPVTSLDHDRKDVIAERLVKEAKKRQVIILTHDIVFMSMLARHAVENSVEFFGHWIKKLLDGTPGVIEHHRNPKLSNLVSLKKDADEAVEGYTELGEKEKEKALGVSLDYLRSACEAMVREILFAGAMKRYDDHIRVQNIEEMPFDKELALQLVSLHGNISEQALMHDRSDEVRGKLPGMEEWNKIRKEFEELERKPKAVRKEARKEREERGKKLAEESQGWL
ncbi:MAG: AAA family ATPase [Cytophagales bacterium]|nr:AAA family ATPase [Cytophagales bacterium]